MERSTLYSISENGDAITCHLCGATSSNTNDIQRRYCGQCHRFLDDVESAMAQGACPDCGARHFRPGPRGGASQNIECRRCKARFNVTWYFGHLIFAERIEREIEGGSRWPEDWFP